MSKKKQKKKYAGVRRVYINWTGMRKCKSNKKDNVMRYFMGAWTAFDDNQAVEFLHMCTKKDLKALMSYPMWM